MIRTLSAPALAFAILAGPLQAQRPVQPRVAASGVITDFSTSAPLNGAVVEFPALRRQTTTDAGGRFIMADIRAGRHKMVVNQLGFRTFVREVEIEEGGFLYVPLEPDPVMLKGIEVQVDRLALRRRGLGRTVETFQRNSLISSAAASAEEFVRQSLSMIPCGSRTACVRRRGQLVQPMVYIDERRAFGLVELDAYPTYDIYLIESYDGGRMIRIYTNWFMARLARTNLPLQNIVEW